MRDDDVREFSTRIYAQSKQSWTDWLRATVGVRGGWYHADVHSATPANSGADSDFITSPKVGLGFNLLDVKRSQIDYSYTSRLAGESVPGVDDIHFDPVEPLGFRLMVSNNSDRRRAEKSRHMGVISLGAS